MFDDLIDYDPEDDEEIAPAVRETAACRRQVVMEHPVAARSDATTVTDASIPALLDAQAATAAWLDALPEDSGRMPVSAALDEEARAAARGAFASVTDPLKDPLSTKAALMTLSAPPAVRHLAGMLSHYDWEFVKEAARIRGFIVAKLLEHASSPDPKISLHALRTLGTVTEVGAYTERVEVAHTHVDATPTAVVERLRARLQGLLPQSRAQSAAEAEIAEAVIVNSSAAPIPAGASSAPFEPPAPPSS